MKKAGIASKLPALVTATERAESQTAPPTEPDKAVVRQDAVNDDDDPELAAYNRFLAKLNALDQQETR